MGRLRPLYLALVALAIVALAPSALATPPTIVQPVGGTEVPSGWTGLIHVTWQEIGEMKVEASGPNGYHSLVGPITVEPPNVGNTYTYSVAPMIAPGTYTISAGRVDGSEAPAQVTVTVPEPPPPPSSATVVAPAFGAVVLAPWDGPIRVRWDVISNPAAWYRVSLNGEALCEFDAVDLTPGQVTSCDLPTNAPLGENWIVLYEAPFSGTPTMIGSSVFHVEPHLAIRSLGLSPARFYPYVRDGYRDRARLAFRLNKEANITFVVRTMRGRLVRRANLGFRADGTWEWNGRKSGGALASVGRYKVTLEARDHGELRKLTRQVVVARGFRTVRDAKSFCGGCGPGQIAAAPGCFIEFNWFSDGDIFLDCWGGEYAIATWVFRVPAKAFKITKTIGGTVRCCAPGEVASVGVRRNARTFVVAAGVSGFRAWEIRWVRIRYSYKVRI
ncbi:MAG TPA: hypothetical protein VD769_07705 [Gaiellaceae bacterium]|nr:hypothetical protein [Gaiellaceae bacterium]